MMVSDHVVLWKRCLKVIRDNVSEATFKTWFTPIKPLKYEDKTLTLQVPSQFFYEFIEDKFIDLLRSTIYREIGEGTQLMYSVMVADDTPIEIPPGPAAPGKVIKDELDSQLKSEYTFESFMQGESNLLTRSVAMSVAENPGKNSFNPLFVYGASGVGKTHLLNAIGNKIKEQYPHKRVLYLSAHLFQVQYTESVRTNTTNDFINFYRSIDVLLMDDIQEFAGVTKTQNTFFHIFNHLHQSGKQLVMTADRNPEDLQGVEERLLTRFRWGMVAQMEQPGFELRRDILKNKIYRDGLSFSDEVVDYIARNVNRSVRDLQGTIIALMAHSTIYNKEIDVELAQRIIHRSSRSEKNMTIDSIVDSVCKHFKLEPALLNTKSRKREVVQARQIAMFLAKKHTDTSSSKIGKFIGGKDHSTVVYSCKIVREQCEVDKTFKAKIETIEGSIMKKR